MRSASRRHGVVLAVAGMLAAALVAGCASGDGDKDDGPAFTPGAPASPGDGSSAQPSPTGKASPEQPLAERAYTVAPLSDARQRAAVVSWKDYMDGVIVAMARNSFSGTVVKDRTTRSGFAASQPFISDQIKKNEVFYGPFRLRVSAPALRDRAGAVLVCVDQSKARFYDKTTGRPKGRGSANPHVTINFFLSHSFKGWLVSGFEVRGRPTGCGG
jgi:hypothetical protein